MAGQPPAFLARSGLSGVGGLDFGQFVKIKNAFFDRDAVLKALERGQLRALSKIGAFVRRRAQTSIRYGKKSSPPGKPPTGHKGVYTRPRKVGKTGLVVRQPVSPLRDLIWFAYDPATKSVVIGPILFVGARKQNPPAPKLLEFGGMVSRRTNDGKVRTFRYRGNPFMRPALAAERGKSIEIFKNIMAGGTGPRFGKE